MSVESSTKEQLEAVCRGDKPATELPKDLVGARLMDAELAGIDLSGRDLTGANLSGANLEGAKLFRTTLKDANLSGANLQRAELSGADLSGAELVSANAAYAGLGQAKLVNAQLFEANFEHATLSLANFRGADMRCANLRDARLRETCLCGTNLTEADLRAAEMSLTDVEGATFTNADLRNARLRAIHNHHKASWIGVDMRNINFAGAYRLRRFIADENYLKEFRESSKGARLLYYLWLVTSDCGRSMGRWLLLILLQVLLFAWLFTLVGVDFGDHQTWLSPLYFSVVTVTTLGFGDVVPSSVAGQVVAMAEVVVGYLMLGGLISIFSNRIARRAD